MAYMEFSGTAVSIARVPASPVRARGRLSGLAAFNYVLDLALIVAFLVDWNLRFTGLTVHEWLGIVLGGVIFLHTVLHWDWIVRTVRRLLTAHSRQRFTAAVNLLLFVDIVLLVASGILISRVAVPGLADSDQFWRWLHIKTAEVSRILLGVHIALSWRWLWAMTKRTLSRAQIPGAGA